MYIILPNLNQSVLHQVKHYELISMIKINTNTDGNRYYLLNHESKKRFSTMRNRCTSCGVSYRKLLFFFHPRSLLNPPYPHYRPTMALRVVSIRGRGIPALVQSATIFPLDLHYRHRVKIVCCVYRQLNNSSSIIIPRYKIIFAIII